MIIGLTSVTFRSLNSSDVIKLSNNVDAIEWGGDIHVPPNNLENAKNVAYETQKAGIKNIFYGSYYKLLSGHNFEDVLQTALILNAKHIRIWAGDISGKTANNAIIKAAADELKRIAELALKSNINIGLEYHPNTLTDNWQSCKKLLDYTECENVFTYWQPNPSLSRNEHLEEIYNLKNYIKAFHVFYWQNNLRLPLEDGFETWKQYINDFTNTDIPLIMEFVKNDNPQQFLKDVVTLKRLALK